MRQSNLAALGGCECINQSSSASAAGERTGHANAYEYVKKGRVVAVCDLKRGPLDEFGDKYDVSRRYTDYREMFEKEQPELVQVSTPPDVRLKVLEAAEAAGVPAAIVGETAGDFKARIMWRCATSPRASPRSKWRSIISCNFIRGGSSCSNWWRTALSAICALSKPARA